MYLFYDTETSGKYDFKDSYMAAHQPHIIQLAVLVLDNEFKEMARLSTLIEPEGWDVEEGALAVHGIHRLTALEYGLKIADALAVFKRYRAKCKFHIAHNDRFDSGMIKAECHRLGKPADFIESGGFCTMLSLTPVLKIPGRFGHKWPKLEEAFRHATGQDMNVWLESKGLGAHDAMADVLAMVEVFKWIKAEHPAILLEGMVS